MSPGIARRALLLTGVGVAAAGGGFWAAQAAPPATVAALGATVWIVPVMVATGAVGVVAGLRAGLWAAPVSTVPATAWMLGAGAGVSSLTASLPLLGCGLLALGGARVVVRFGAPAEAAILLPALAVAAAVALPLVSDPWIEWDGSAPYSPGRAARVIALDPVSALGSAADGVAWDRQRGRVLYSGASGDGAGLSVIGQYYPARPTSAVAWGGIAAVIGLGLALGGRLARRRDGPAPGEAEHGEAEHGVAKHGGADG